MATCSSGDPQSATNSSLEMCRVNDKFLGERDCNTCQASTSVPVKEEERKGSVDGRMVRGRGKFSSKDDLPVTINLPDGEELYLSRRLNYDSRKPADDCAESCEDRKTVIPGCGSSRECEHFPGDPDPSTSLPTGLSERRGSGLPSRSSLKPTTSPPPWPWPCEQYGSCVNPPPNRTICQVSDRPRAHSMSKLLPLETRKKTSVPPVVTRKTVTSPGNIVGK